MTTHWYATITELLKHLAHEACGDRLLFVLEGGYNPVSLEASVLATVESMLHPVGRRPGSRLFRTGGANPHQSSVARFLDGLKGKGRSV